MEVCFSTFAQTIRSGLRGGPLGTVEVPSAEATNVCNELREIIVNYDASAICTIEVLYENRQGRLDRYGPWGGSPKIGKWQKEEVCIKKGEMLKSIEGTYHTAHGVHCITSLTFKTNKDQQKTIGHVRGTKFSYDTPNGQIIGFYGRFGTYTNAIGIYLAPNPRSTDNILGNILTKNIILVGLWGGPGGSMKAPPEGTVTRFTVLKQIIINYDIHAIHTFKFFYHNGFINSCESWGTWKDKCVEEKMTFEDGEMLIAIGGTYDIVEGCLVVTSLTFRTNKNNNKTIGHKNNHMKHGHVEGTEFWFGTPDGKIVSFYGRFGGYMDAFGVYLAPIKSFVI